MSDIEIEENEEPRTWKRSELRKILAIFVGLFVIAFIMIIALGVVVFILWSELYLTQTPTVSVLADPLTSQFETVLTNSNVSMTSVESLTQIKTKAATPLTYSFQSVLKKSGLTNGTFNCSILNSEDPCPNHILKWNNLTKSVLQNQLIDNNYFSSIFSSSQLSFENDNISFKVREKYGIRDPRSEFKELDETLNVFKSLDFDWSQNIIFANNKLSVNVFENSGPKIENFCQTEQVHSPLYKITIAQDVWNLATTVFEVQEFNLTWTTGFNEDWHPISEYVMIGKVRDFKDIGNNVEDFLKHQKKWCDCVANRKKFGADNYKEKDAQDICSFKTNRKDLAAVFEYKMCPIVLEQRIKATL